ncbi:MAG: CPBP family glutamic-type intramembrane protease [Vulcanimicrobiota bacterium]
MNESDPLPAENAEELPPDPPEPPRAPPFFGPLRALLAFLVYQFSFIMGGFAVGFAYGIKLAIDGATSFENTPELTTVLHPWVLLVGGPLGTVMLGLYLYLSLQGDLARLGMVVAERAHLIKAGLMGAVLGGGFSWWSHHTAPKPDFEPGPLVQMATSSSMGQTAWLVMALLVAPIAEELLFRGAIFEGLKARLTAYPSAIIVTILFSLLHLGETGGHWPAVLSVTLLGVVLMALRLHTGSLWPSMVCHFCYNLALALTFLLLTGPLAGPRVKAMRAVQAGEKEQALVYLEKAIAAEPQDGNLYALRGQLKAKLNRLDGAMEDFDRALELGVPKPRILNEKAYFLATAGRYEEALEPAREAARLSPESANVQDTLAYTLAGMKRYDEALEVYELALELDPDHAYAHYGRGLVYRELGRTDEAEVEVEVGLELDPSLQEEWVDWK